MANGRTCCGGVHKYCTLGQLLVRAGDEHSVFIPEYDAITQQKCSICWRVMVDDIVVLRLVLVQYTFYCEYFNIGLRMNAKITYVQSNDH